MHVCVFAYMCISKVKERKFFVTELTLKIKSCDVKAADQICTDRIMKKKVAADLFST